MSKRESAGGRADRESWWVYFSRLFPGKLRAILATPPRLAIIPIFHWLLFDDMAPPPDESSRSVSQLGAAVASAKATCHDVTLLRFSR